MLLEARDITKTYATRAGSFTALDHVGFSVDEGDIVGLIGASGSGKSTVASIVSGLELADSGTLSLLGASCDASQRISHRPAAFRAALRSVQMVFQNPQMSFSDRMRLGEGIAEGIAYLGVPKAEHAARVAQALEMVGLPQSYARKFAWELSGGECQRAAIARAIIGRPRLLLCDEPTSSLDVTVQAQIVHLLADLCREMGMSCLFISHDLALVRGLCSWVYVLDDGRVVEEGTPAQAFEHPRSEAARRLAASAVTLDASKGL